MKIGLFFATTFSLTITSLSLAQQPAAVTQTTPKLTMHCVNPGVDVKFTSVQGTQASTEPVQFNVNIPAGPGTVFVDGNNSGVCTATISDGYQFTSGSGTISPTAISVSSPATPTQLRGAIIISSQILGNQTMALSVSRGSSDVKGNANIYFIVRYRKD